jgi:hypothetical protein
MVAASIGIRIVRELAQKEVQPVDVGGIDQKHNHEVVRDAQMGSNGNVVPELSKMASSPDSYHCSLGSCARGSDGGRGGC